MQAIDKWLAYVGGNIAVEDVFQALSAELPPLASLILDRSCKFQCQHCIFQSEKSIRGLPSTNAVLHVLNQLPNVQVVHEGRQLTSAQIPLLEDLVLAGYPLGIIESGTYVLFVDEILRSNLRFDWMDVSIDGPKGVHNLQRGSAMSWDIAALGLRRAREVLTPKGKVTSLMTITSLNFEHVFPTWESVFGLGVDEWHLTTMSLRGGIEGLRASEKQLEKALSQMLEVGRSGSQVFFRIYNLDDVRAIISIFGKEYFSKLLTGAEVTRNALVLDIGVPLLFYPTSLAPGETLVVDVDGWWRLPYCIKYTLKELRDGRDALGQDISIYNVTEVSECTHVVQTYKSAVNRWRRSLGSQYLKKEQALFSNLL